MQVAKEFGFNSNGFSIYLNRNKTGEILSQNKTLSLLKIKYVQSDFTVRPPEMSFKDHGQNRMNVPFNTHGISAAMCALAYYGVP